MRTSRKIACHQILLPDGSSQTLSVIEIQSGEVTKWYPLTEEQAHTEWLCGTVSLAYDRQSILRAHHKGQILQ